MKNSFRLPFILPVSLLVSHQLAAQSNFSPEAYMQFRQEHIDYEAEALLEDFPPRTTYYSDRQIPADLYDIPWFDKLDGQFQFTAHEKELLGNNHFMVTERIGSMDWASAFIGVYN
ncbi:MAG: hypothetical protein EHM46_01200, partial [Bacteroidetes bacterium]